MKFVVPKNKFTDLERIELEGLESRARNFIYGCLNEVPHTYKFSITLSSEVIYFTGEKYVFHHNASISLENSYKFAGKINDFLKTLYFPSLSHSYTIVFCIGFRENQGTKKEDSKSQFTAISPRFNFGQIILTESVRKELLDGISLIKNHKLIYEKWGFKDIDPIAKSILNLYGPPGTGKTMIAHAIAYELRQPLLALKYSEIESKYLGEATKNLMAAFDIAARLNAVIFFDEADSFLGKRVENVTQGSDQALNSLRSQMLILLEEFSGTVIFATNLVTNFDPAFESRILKHIKIDLPNKDARAQIIRKMIPHNLPVDTEWTKEQIISASDEIEGLSGREIKSAILEMLLSKANTDGENAVFCFNDLLQSMRKKKASIEKLKAEENARTKQRIIRKLKEKVEEEKLTEDFENERKFKENVHEPLVDKNE